MLKKVVIGLVCVLGVLAIVIATRPDSLHVERSAQIAAPPAVVFEQVNDFRRWSPWSPWEKIDPGMKKTFSGPAAGAGASYHWVGNDEVGEGRMTITESKPPERVLIKLEFLKPFAATNDTTFTFAEGGAGTKVTWAMDGRNNFMMKAYSLFNDMDAMIGKDFDKGLASMKGLAEEEAKRRAEAAARAAQQAAPPAADAAPPAAPVP